MGSISVHNDLGTFLKDGIFIGNSFLYEWYLDKILDKENQKESIINFSSAIGQFSSYLHNIFFQSYEPRSQVVIGMSAIKYIDYNVGQKSYELFNDEYDLKSNLLLFNVLSTVNFVSYYLSDLFSNDSENSLFFRIKYASYYSVMMSIQKLETSVEGSINRKMKTGIENYKSELSKLGDLKNEDFRDCIFHYGVTVKDISLTELKIDVPFLGLVEKYFGMSYVEFNAQIDNRLNTLSDLVTKWILKIPLQKSPKNF